MQEHYNLFSDSRDSAVKIKPISFWSCILDMQALPDAVETREAESFLVRRARNNRRIRSYFDKAFGKFRQEENV